MAVIPARDPRTYGQTGAYFLLFSNPASARVYQNQVVHLHRVARTHTPTSIESPLPLQPGVLVQGEDVYALLQDYALCPPSQRIQLRLLTPPYSSNIKAVFQDRGYTQLGEREAGKGRPVLIWCDGPQVTTYLVRNAINADGRHQGLAWNFTIEKVDTSQAVIDDEGGFDISENEKSSRLGFQRPSTSKWILFFKDENEARRFVRSWHQKSLLFDQKDNPRMVYTKLC